MMRILLFSLKQSIFLDTRGFIKVLATLELQTEATCAQKNALFSTEKYSHRFSLQTV